MRIGFVTGLLLAFAIPAAAEESIQFERDVAPLVKRHCVKCHGPAKQEAKLDLSTSGGWIRGGKSGSAIVPHDAAGSLVWQKVDTDEMPPESPLSASEKALLKKWIVQGTAGLKQDDGNGPHWSFRLLEPSLWTHAASSQSVKAENPIDYFLLTDLAMDGLSFQPEADRSAVIRRVSFDLLGLPPTPDAVVEYVNDPNPDAHERLLDRTLASPHFGERIGKIWLDAAGYADSNGYFNADTDRPLAYRYRDYVIRSLNADKPFDQFVREQIAGDEMASITARMGESVVVPDSPSDEQDSAERVTELWDATHFLRNGQDGTGESDGNPDEVRVDRYTVIETAMQNISTSLLGLTIQCAKCHDHKFEPLTQRDYYSFQAVLIPAFPPEQWKKPNERFVHISRASELENWQARLAESEQQVVRLQSEIQAWVQSNRPAGNRLFSDDFAGDPALLLQGWSHTAPGDDKPGGAAINLNSREAPGAIIVDGHLQIIEGGPSGDKWLSTQAAFDWTPDTEGASIQVTFDLVENRVAESKPAERIGYFIATHDFDNSSSTPGGDILIDGNPTAGSEVLIDYPANSSKSKGTLGKTGYAPGHNYGVRITNLGKGKYQLQHLVDWLVDEPTIKLSEKDLPNGGFGFEYCCERSFVVDNVVVETFVPQNGSDPLGTFLKELGSRRGPLDEAIKTKTALANSKPGKIAWTTDLVEQPPQVHIFERGNYATPGQPVEPAGFAVLGESTAGSSARSFGASKPANLKSTGSRRAFANWLTQPDSKPAALMARVQVNRLWQQAFGIGLVATTDNFGQSGPAPSNRELLDWTAAELIWSKWSIKRMVRLIASSAAYRQSSLRSQEELDGSGLDTVGESDRRWTLDADGRRLSRFPVRRLDAESIRDMLLAASGDLDERMYGPYVPTTRTGNGETVVPEDKSGVARRSIYLQQKRTQVHSLLQVFDAPSIVFNSTRRPRSTMPLQSLSLLNSDFVVARSRHMAERLERDFISESQRVQQAFLQTVGRVPSEADISATTRFLHEQRSDYAEHADAASRAWTDLCQILLVENASIYIE